MVSARRGQKVWGRVYVASQVLGRLGPEKSSRPFSRHLVFFFSLSRRRPCSFLVFPGFCSTMNPTFVLLSLESNVTESLGVRL